MDQPILIRELLLALDEGETVEFRREGGEVVVKVKCGPVNARKLSTLKRERENLMRSEDLGVLLAAMFAVVRR